MFKQTFLTLALIAPLAASAGNVADFARVTALLDAGSSIAQYETSLTLDRLSEEKAVEQASRNFLIHDFNRDGLEDVLVIAEPKGAYWEYGTEEPCALGNESQCRFVHGNRSLELFLGGQGRVLKNTKIIGAIDDGGMFGDALEGLTPQKNGSVRIASYGGSAERVAQDEIIQFRRGEFYLIGSEYEMNWTNGDEETESRSINYITGRQVYKYKKNERSREKVKVSYLPRKPLVKIVDYEGYKND